jgi:hypothetical protein
LFGVRLALGQLNVGFQVAAEGRKFFVRGQIFFRALAVPQYFLRGFLIAPEIGISGALVQRFQLGAIVLDVKDSSARGRCVVSSLRTDAADPPKS